jgi:hypothetical protein
MRSIGMTAIIAAIVLVGLPSNAQETFFYPARGQSQYQQNQDQGQCHMWAVQQTGYNPFAPPSYQAYGGQEQGYGGGLLRGAFGGAAVGAIGGAIGGNAGKGAAIGAGVGLLFGGWRRHREMVEQEEEQQQGTYQQQQRNQAYQGALAACMRGRGYTVG